ncbi:hypothetical protein KUW17_23140, partial [Leisingera aquaemixtae]|uniref:hypothetical protein n=1 Tax=Leisingera aquaemixtae TaxID=1396826 RepID=UPI001C9523D7
SNTVNKPISTVLTSIESQLPRLLGRRNQATVIISLSAVQHFLYPQHCLIQMVVQDVLIPNH